MRLGRVLPALAVATAAAALLALLFIPTGEAPRLRMASGASGGEYRRFATALAELARRHDPRFELIALESHGADANALALADGQAELGLVQSDTLLPPNVRAVAALFPEVLHLVVRRDAQIARFDDLAGKRVALMSEGSGSNAVFFRLAAHYGLGPADFDLRPLPPAEAAAALQRGEVDAMARMIALGAQAMRELLADPGLGLLGLDQAEAIQLFAPALRRISVPRGALGGRPPRPAEAIEAIGVQAVLVASATAPESAVRELTALMFDYRNELLGLHAQTALMQSPEVLKDIGIPIHPGADAYFRADDPPFLVRYAETLALCVSVTVLIISATWQMRRWLSDKAKNRGDAYNLELAETIEAVRHAPDTASLTVLEDRLFAIFRRVLADIDEDRLARESIPAFDFVWRSAVDVLGQRRAELCLRSPTILARSAPLAAAARPPARPDAAAQPM